MGSFQLIALITILSVSCSISYTYGLIKGKEIAYAQGFEIGSVICAEQRDFEESVKNLNYRKAYEKFIFKMQ